MGSGGDEGRAASPCWDHAWIMAGGANSPQSFRSPSAWLQWWIIAVFTGSGHGGKARSPSAATCSASAISRSCMLSPSATEASARGPRQAEADHRDDLTLDLVDAAAEGQHQGALHPAVQPFDQVACLLVARVAVPRQRLADDAPGVLHALRAADLGGRGVRRAEPAEVHAGRDLPVEQLVDAQEGVDLGDRAAYGGLLDQRPPVPARLGPRPGGEPVVGVAEVARRAERDPLVVELVDDEVPALVLLADEHVDRDT